MSHLDHSRVPIVGSSPGTGTVTGTGTWTGTNSELELPPSELSALRQFYTQCNGSNWQWKGTGAKWAFSEQLPLAQPCRDRWEGVTCICHNGSSSFEPPPAARDKPEYDYSYYIYYYYSDSPAVRVALPHNRTSYNCSISKIILPSYSLAGSIPTAIFLLPNLIQLNLKHNQLVGSISPALFDPLPPSLSPRPLRDVVLSINLLSGSVPSNIGNAIYLEHLSLAHNPMITGIVPTSLTKLTNLQTLRLGTSLLSKTIPHGITNLVNLEVLSIALSQISGPLIPSFIAFRKLRALAFDNNYLSGPLSPDLCELPFLRQVYISGNSLTGVLPTCLFALSLLETLEIGFNDFKPSTIPLDIESAKSLEYLFMGGLNLFQTIPESLGKLSRLKALSLASNPLTGTLPTALSGLTALQTLYLSECNLSGTLPSFVSALSSLQVLHLRNNRFRGPIPSQLGLNFALSDLDLSSNQLISSIPIQLQQLTNLQTLLLNGNAMTGSLSPQLFNSSNGNQHLSKLNRIDISDNLFTGDLPANIWSTVGLSLFGASRNCLFPSIPSGICAASQLQLLALNGLSTASGCAKNGEFTFVSAFTGAYVIQGSTRGRIPSCVFALSKLTYLGLSGNAIHSPIELIDGNRVGSQLTTLIISHNFITSTIPSALQLKSNWEEFDASFNQITGTLIPSVQYSSKTSFTVIANRLSGPIPKAMLTLPKVSILEGNYFSCGVFSSISTEELPANDPYKYRYTCGSNDVYTTLVVWLVVGTFVLGACSGLAIFILHRWRRFRSSGDQQVHRLSPSRVIFARMIINDLRPVLKAVAWLLPALVPTYNLTGNLHQNVPGMSVDGTEEERGGRISPKSLPEETGKMESTIETLIQRFETRVAPFKQATLYSTILIVCVLTPIYAILKSITTTTGGVGGHTDSYPTYSTHYYTYVWVTSSSYFQGVTPSVVLGIFVPAIIAGCRYIFWRQLRNQSYSLAQPDEVDTDLPLFGDATLPDNVELRPSRVSSFMMRSMSMMSTFYSDNSQSQSFFSTSTSQQVAQQPQSRKPPKSLYASIVQRMHSYRRRWPRFKKILNHYLFLLCVALINFVVVGAANGAYIYGLTSIPDEQLVALSSIALSIFKITWTSLAIPRLLQFHSEDNVTRDDRLGTKFSQRLPIKMSILTREVTFLGLLAILNTIIIPCVAIVVISPQCLYYFLIQQAPRIYTNYGVTECEGQVPTSSGSNNMTVASTPRCFTPETVLKNIVVNPPFIYTFECSATLLSSYTAVFIYVFIVQTFVSPVMWAFITWVLNRLRPSDNASAPSVGVGWYIYQLRTGIYNTISALTPTILQTREYVLNCSSVRGRIAALTSNNYDGNQRSDLYGSDLITTKEVTNSDVHPTSKNVHGENVDDAAVDAPAFEYVPPETSAQRIFVSRLLVVQVLQMLSIICSFGVVFPLLAFLGLIAVYARFWMHRVMLVRFYADVVAQSVTTGKDSSTANSLSVSEARDYENRFMHCLNRDCEGLGALLSQCVWVVFPIGYILFAMFLFDIVGSDSGSKTAALSFLVLLIVPATQALVWWALSHSTAIVAAAAATPSPAVSDASRRNTRANAWSVRFSSASLKPADISGSIDYSREPSAVEMVSVRSFHESAKNASELNDGDHVGHGSESEPTAASRVSQFRTSSIVNPLRVIKQNKSGINDQARVEPIVKTELRML